MKTYDQESFNQFVLDHNVLGFFDQPITLKSGRKSNWYVNWRSAAEDAYSLDVLTDYVLAFTHSLITDGKLTSSPDCFYGVPEGATKLGILTQYKWAKQSETFSKGSHVLPMGRAKPKEHGVAKDKYFVGMPTGSTIVLEDTTTTGGSMLTSIDALLEAGINVIAAIGLTNRMELRDDRLSVAEAVNQKTVNGVPIPYFHLSSALVLLPLAYKKLQPGPETAKAIEREFEEYGVEKISF